MLGSDQTGTVPAIPIKNRRTWQFTNSLCVLSRKGRPNRAPAITGAQLNLHAFPLQKLDQGPHPEPGTTFGTTGLAALLPGHAGNV